MAADWQRLAFEQTEIISNHIRELLSSGLNFLSTEYGLELGLKPELYPSWAILSTTFIGVILVVSLVWAAACGGGRRKQATVVPHETRVQVTDSHKAPESKTIKTEEQKKKNRKKATEKQKAQPNGQTVPEAPVQDVIKVKEESPKPQPDVKVEKVKKTKKKPKPEVTESQSVLVLNGKEPDEGAWETKVSNKEKRQQRKKEKSPNNGSGSPDGADRASQPPEQPLAPAGTKRNRETSRTKTGKSDATIASAPAYSSNLNPANGGGWVDMSVKMTPQTNALEGEKWPSAVKKASGHRHPELLTWGQMERERPWTAVDGRLKPEISQVNFSLLALNPKGGEPLSQPMDDMQWGSLAAADNEWSGFNGQATDSNSDWNAPTELWGNYEEPVVEATAPPEPPMTQPPELLESDDDKDKGDATGSGKSKKKKKKKKKQEGEGAPGQVSTETSAAPPEGTVSKPRLHVPPEEPARTPAGKQGSSPQPSQKKLEQSWEPPKQAPKKRARRET